jgi:hypothetical protein
MAPWLKVWLKTVSISLAVLIGFVLVLATSDGTRKNSPPSTAEVEQDMKRIIADQLGPGRRAIEVNLRPAGGGDYVGTALLANGAVVQVTVTVSRTSGGRWEYRWLLR